MEAPASATETPPSSEPTNEQPAAESTSPQDSPHEDPNALFGEDAWGGLTRDMYESNEPVADAPPQPESSTPSAPPTPIAMLTPQTTEVSQPVQESLATPPDVDNSHRPLSFHEAEKAWMGLDFAQELPRIVPMLPLTCMQRMLCCLRPASLSTELTQQRDKLFALALRPFEESELCVRALQTIYRKLTGNRHCPRCGRHWEEIGFQGDDPQTDLRSCGLLAVLQIVFLVTRHQGLAHELYLLSHHETQHFPLCTISVNMTGVVLALLRKGALNRLARAEGSLTKVFHIAYVSCFYRFLTLWKEGKTMRDSGFVLDDLRTQCMRAPLQVIEEYGVRLNTRQAQPDPGTAFLDFTQQGRAGLREPASGSSAAGAQSAVSPERTRAYVR